MNRGTGAARLASRALFLLALSTPALGHDSAQWIADGGYVTKNGTHCCGVNDCEMIPDEMVRRVTTGDETGWEIEGDFFADTDFGRGLHASIDEHFWRCKWGGHNRCLFTSETGT